MKVKLTVIEVGLFEILKRKNKSHREHRQHLNTTVASGVDLTGKTIEIRGQTYFVIEQYQAATAVAKNKRRKWSGSRKRVRDAAKRK